MGGVCPIAFCERLCVAGHHEQSRRRWRGCQGGGKCPSSIEQAVARLHVNMGRGDVRRVQHIADATEGLRKGGRIAVCGQKRGRKNLDARVPANCALDFRAEVAISQHQPGTIGRRVGAGQRTNRPGELQMPVGKDSIIGVQPVIAHLKGFGVTGRPSAWSGANPVTGAVPRRTRQFHVGFGRMRRVWGPEGVDGVEVGVEGAGVIRVLSQGPDAVVMRAGQCFTDGVSRYRVGADFDEGVVVGAAISRLR